MTISARAVRVALKPAAFAASLAPLACETWAALDNQLGVDPYRAITRDTGLWTLRFLCLTLAVTPLRRLTSWHALVRFRRMLGLFAFFYGTIHFLTYVVFDRFAGLDFPKGLVSSTTAVDLMISTGGDVLKRPFLAIGLAALLVMVPLAVTSTTGMVRRLGGRRWQRLHRLVYGAAIAGLLHHWWPLADRFRVDTYGMWVGVLILFRMFWSRTRAPRPSSAGTGR